LFCLFCLSLTLQNPHDRLRSTTRQGRTLSGSTMKLAREYVAYISKQVLKQLSQEGLIQFDQAEYVQEVMTQVLLDELSIEDHINEEVRKILEEHNDEMKRMGVSYDDMFRKVKRQLVRDRNIVL
jgi:hypothetical protein